VTYSYTYITYVLHSNHTVRIERIKFSRSNACNRSPFCSLIASYTYNPTYIDLFLKFLRQTHPMRFLCSRQQPILRSQHRIRQHVHPRAAVFSLPHQPVALIQTRLSRVRVCSKLAERGAQDSESMTEIECTRVDGGVSALVWVDAEVGDEIGYDCEALNFDQGRRRPTSNRSCSKKGFDGYGSCAEWLAKGTHDGEACYGCVQRWLRSTLGYRDVYSNVVNTSFWVGGLECAWNWRTDKGTGRRRIHGVVRREQSEPSNLLDHRSLIFEDPLSFFSSRSFRLWLRACMLLSPSYLLHDDLRIQPTAQPHKRPSHRNPLRDLFPLCRPDIRALPPTAEHPHPTHPCCSARCVCRLTRRSALHPLLVQPLLLAPSQLARQWSSVLLESRAVHGVAEGGGSAICARRRRIFKWTCAGKKERNSGGAVFQRLPLRSTSSS
jgi:hypothetical protein